MRVKERLKSIVKLNDMQSIPIDLPYTCMQFKARVTKGGELVVVTQKHRSQAMNLNEAVQRVGIMLAEASEVPKGPSQLTIARVKAL